MNAVLSSRSISALPPILLLGRTRYEENSISRWWFELWGKQHFSMEWLTFVRVPLSVGVEENLIWSRPPSSFCEVCLFVFRLWSRRRNHRDGMVNWSGRSGKERHSEKQIVQRSLARDNLFGDEGNRVSLKCPFVFSYPGSTFFIDGDGISIESWLLLDSTLVALESSGKKQGTASVSVCRDKVHWWGGNAKRTVETEREFGSRRILMLSS